MAIGLTTPIEVVDGGGCRGIIKFKHALNNECSKSECYHKWRLDLEKKGGRMITHDTFSTMLTYNHAKKTLVANIYSHILGSAISPNSVSFTSHNVDYVK